MHAMYLSDRPDARGHRPALGPLTLLRGVRLQRLAPARSHTAFMQPQSKVWLVTGSAAAVASTLVLSLCGWIENRNAVAPNNGPSQWVWGRRSARRRSFSIPHTLAAYAIHHGSSLMWSAVHQALFVRDRRPRPASRRLVEGAATAALACFVDYRCTPQRFRPGFEKHLSRGSLLCVYAGFGAALGVATWLLTRDKSHEHSA